VTCYKQRVIYEKYGIVTRSRQEAMIIKREKQFAEAEKVKQQQLYCEDGRKAINCNKDGNRCKYHVNHNEYKCNYIGIVGHMRGCEPCMCTKWQLKICTPELCNRFNTETCNKDCCKLWSWRTEKVKEKINNVAQDRCKQSEYVSNTI
jgi:hypothetical protein